MELNAKERTAMCMFAMTRNMTFHERERKMSDEAVELFGNLVDKGLLTLRPFNQYGGKVYSPTQAGRDRAWELFKARVDTEDKTVFEDFQLTTN